MAAPMTGQPPSNLKPPRRWKTAGRWSAEDTFALEAMRPLGESFLPWTGYAMSPSAILKVLVEAELYQARTILELGAGLSTVYLARFARASSPRASRVVSVDNDADWLERIRKYLEREELLGFVELVHARRESWKTAATLAEEPSAVGWKFALPGKWYAVEPILNALGADEVDLLVVDGPRGSGAITRYPALIELQDRLSEEPTVILDDAERPPETEIISRWSARTHMEFVLHKGTNIAVGRPPSRHL